jgi:hypothetical protein
LGRSRITTELEAMPPVDQDPAYQDPTLLKQAWATDTGKVYALHGVYNQPTWGYCGYAAINTALLSFLPQRTTGPDDNAFVTNWKLLPDSKASNDNRADTYKTHLFQAEDHVLLRVPPRLQPVDGTAVAEILEAVRRGHITHLNDEGDGKKPGSQAIHRLIDRVEWFSAPLAIDVFYELVRDINNPKYRFLANVLRQQLWFSDQPKSWNIIHKYLSGHWLPLASAVKHNTSKDTYILALDENPQYGPVMIAADRMLKAINTRSVLDGSWRGIVRVTLK